MEYGLRLNTVDMDKMVRVNDLKECTDPIMMIKRTPTQDGILSYDIFGMSTEERKTRMAYIDLHGKYMHPLAAKKLWAYDRRLNNILYSLKRYKLVDGDVVEDENGEMGPEFLYRIWDKVKSVEKNTLLTKEVEIFFRRPKNKLFIDKFLIIPPATRDINTSGGGMGTNIINKKYCAIISYTQSMEQYTDSFTDMRYITQSRVQSLLVDIYDELVINKIKGNPSKRGMLRRDLMSKNIDYSCRLVITATNLFKETVDDVQVKMGYATIPLHYICSLFFPFVAHHLKLLFDNDIIRGGRRFIQDKDGNPIPIDGLKSIDDNEVMHMILRFINSPASRFDKVEVSAEDSTKKYTFKLEGRFLKTESSFSRDATLTDIMYIAASRAVKDKHVFVTRFPVTTYNSQFVARILISSTQETEPVMIGTDVYQFFPKTSGRFMNSLQMSDAQLGILGADFDGDQVSSKSTYTIEANEEAEKRLKSLGSVMDITGKIFTTVDKDFHVSALMITHINEPNRLAPIRTAGAKFVI